VTHSYDHVTSCCLRVTQIANALTMRTRTCTLVFTLEMMVFFSNSQLCRWPVSWQLQRHALRCLSLSRVSCSEARVFHAVPSHLHSAKSTVVDIVALLPDVICSHLKSTTEALANKMPRFLVAPPVGGRDTALGKANRGLYLSPAFPTCCSSRPRQAQLRQSGVFSRKCSCTLSS
jgi:hypothetical protein